MPIKQMEMDEIIDQIHAFIKDQDKMNGHSTAIVVVGDHGMTATGNHGGASDAETLTAAFIISERLKELTLGQTWPAHQQGTYEFYRTILQSDFVPMLSMLTGTPIPVNSIGKVPIIALGLWRDSKDRLRALRQNARQLQQLLLAGGISKRIRTTLPCTKGPENAECDLAQLDFAFNSSEADERDLLEALDVMQIILKASSNDYSMPDMFLGLGILGSTALVALTSYLFAFRSRFELLLLLVPVGYAATAFASSFVEEEQVFWYFLTAALLSVVQYAHARQSASLHLNTALTTMAPLLLFRLLRRFNQTGQKHAGMDDLSAWLKYEPVLFDRLLIATFLATGLLLSRHARLNLAWLPFYLAFGSIAFFKLSSHSGYGGLADVWIAKPLSAWLSMGIGSILVRLQRSSSATTSLLQVLAALIFCLQARIDNLPILLLLLGIARSLRDNKGILRPAWLEKCIFIVLCSLQQSSFFAMGNSNALSGLDLSQAYNGIGSYNAVLVGLLLFISSFLGAFFWQVEIIVWTRRPAQNTEPDRGSFARAYMIVLSTSYAFALCLSCHILRHHLFVYSVSHFPSSTSAHRIRSLVPNCSMRSRGHYSIPSPLCLSKHLASSSLERRCCTIIGRFKYLVCTCNIFRLELGHDGVCNVLKVTCSQSKNGRSCT